LSVFLLVGLFLFRQLKQTAICLGYLLPLGFSQRPVVVIHLSLFPSAKADGNLFGVFIAVRL
jgi:hypothetical protein